MLVQEKVWDSRFLRRHQANLLGIIQLPLLHVLQQVPHTSIRLLASGHDLRRRQDKAVVAPVAQLGSENVVSTDNIVGIVDTAAGGLIDRGADRARLEAGTVDFLNGGRGALRKRLQLLVVGGDLRAGVSISWRGSIIRLVRPNCKVPKVPRQAEDGEGVRGRGCSYES